jgi:ABC-2 type transport system permease protein
MSNLKTMTTNQSTTVPAVCAPASITTQVVLLTRRLLLNTWRNPAVMLPNFFITLFFLFAYDGLLGGSADVEALTGGNYVNFILPVVILFASLSGGNSGLALVHDMEAGYFRRQLAMPLSRIAIVLAPILSGALQVVVQCVFVLILGLIIGADPATGFLGLIVVIGFAMLWGMAYAGYSVATGLKTGNAQAAQSAGLIFFPLMFLAPVLLPKEELKGWMQTLATINPTTYVLEGMRAVLIDGWELEPIAKGILAGGIFAIVMLAWAVSVARSATSRS